MENIKTLRKDRVADLKAEKANLESLAKEKKHADTKKKTMADLTSEIAAKEIEYEETQKLHQAVRLSNKRFVEQATHFREIYMKAENAQKQKLKLEEDLQEILSTVKGVTVWIWGDFLPNIAARRDLHYEGMDIFDSASTKSPHPCHNQ